MKISQDMIDAAFAVFVDEPAPPKGHLIAALEAALKVRKARKAAKREKAGLFANLTPEQQAAALAYRGPETHGDATFTTPKPLTIEVGKSYRTRDWQRVDIAVNDGSDKYCLGGKFYSGGLPGWWTIDGCYSFGRTHDLDLISEWQE